MENAGIYDITNSYGDILLDANRFCTT